MKHPDVWQAGDPYERYVGRWSRRVAPVFLAWLDVEAQRQWLDVGCGTGALTSTILRDCSPSSVTGVEPSPGFLALAESRLTDPRTQFLAGDAESLPLADSAVDAVVSGLVLNFVPQPTTALTEWQRVVRADGVVAVYVWDYGDGMELMRRFWSAAIEIDAGAVRFDEGSRFRSLCTPDGLAALWEQADLRDIETRAIDVPTIFAGFDDYWTPFLGGQGVAPAYVATLDQDHVEMLRERIRERLPIASDGSIALSARAWAVRGRKP